MLKPWTVGVYSETGGATKTTTAVSLAVAWALEGKRVLLGDLDPRSAATKWTGVQPRESGLHIGAILAEPDPLGWAQELAVPVSWPQTPTLSVLPSARQLSNREKDSEDHAEIRLQRALQDTDFEIVVLDAPNRQGGPLIQNMLNACDKVVYAGQLDEDGLDGVEGAILSVKRFREHRQLIGAPNGLAEAGIVVGKVRDTIMSRDARRVLELFEREHSTLMRWPLIPERVIVREARAAGDFYGWFPQGERVFAPYRTIAGEMIHD